MFINFQWRKIRESHTEDQYWLNSLNYDEYEAYKKKPWRPKARYLRENGGVFYDDNEVERRDDDSEDDKN